MTKQYDFRNFGKAQNVCLNKIRMTFYKKHTHIRRARQGKAVTPCLPLAQLSTSLYSFSSAFLTVTCIANHVRINAKTLSDRVTCYTIKDHRRDPLFFYVSVNVSSEL